MKKTAMLAAILAATPALAYQPHNYTYVELGWWERTDELGSAPGLPGDDMEADGFSIAGSYRTEGGALFQLNYADGEVDEMWGVRLSGTGLSLDTLRYGVFVGGASQINERTSFWGGLGYDREELEGRITGLGSDDATIDALHFGGGFRFSVVPMLELNAGLRIINFDSDDVSGSDNDAEVALGARVQPVHWMSAGVSYAHLLDADSEIIKADVRFQF